MTDVRVVTFPNADGQMLFGTLHTPVALRAGLPTVVLMSPGVKMRVGPGRLYLPLTDLLTSLGYRVLRFDFHGLGDSEDDLPETVLVDVYNNIEVGRFVDDSQCALDWLRRECGATRFIAGGLCGGAITALLTAERDHGIEALLSIGMTVTLASDAATPAKYQTSAELSHLRQGYLRKLLDPRSWMRLLTFRSDLSGIWRSMLAATVKRRKPAPLPAGSTMTPEQLVNVNPLFPEAFFAFLGRGGRALMLFSEKDRLYGEYREKFFDFHAARMRRFAPQVVEHVIPGANHVLALREWQQEMLDVSRQWLGRIERA